MDEDGSRRTIPDMLCFLLAQKKFKQRNSLNRKNKVLLFCFKKQNSTGVQEYRRFLKQNIQPINTITDF